ncbi:hypothetical protein TraAM80_00081 [Trypanosoma rangeli]|uniref:Uncharacterized protein n=1 Tax=Trypanosoma rangeli TaxID=5698 RepID=A0A3R7MXE0_TRYRA|nr:uncharacterized protein TraAM80_00081 [Trypanosoma rangeli]RNF12729.1 hypothetical protein TraAM80_00081 [Trypanosoma rangeli]|eukprot:RNF12729.1 hypothetical protein TraAM80_00081 [Trypanosoma rangeli]
MTRAGRKSLQREVMDVEHKIVIETSKRQDAEKALLQYRSQQPPPLFGMSHEMRSILDEIEQVKEEKRTLRECLERGVVEAERVSGQLSHASEAIHHTEALEKEIRQTLQKMKRQHTELQQQLHGTRMQVRLMQQGVDSRESSGAVQGAQNSLTNVEYDPPLEDYLHITKKPENLKDKSVLLEKAEAAMKCLTACSRCSLHKLGKISVALNTNSMCDDMENTSNESNSFDSEEGADDARPPRVLFSSARVVIDRCDSCLCTIWSGLSRAGFDQLHLRRQRDMQFQEACMVVERDLATTVGKCSASLQELGNKVAVWKKKRCTFERLALEAESAYQCDVATNSFQGEGDGDPSNDAEAKNVFAESFADAEKRRALLLGNEHRRLYATNKALKMQLETSMSDYESVRELKHAYRDLEVRKAELAHVNKQMRATNRWMKQCTWELDEKAVMDSAGTLT